MGSRPMRYISLFSGIEAASVAWEPLGWEPLAFCEVDDFPSAVLAHRWPNVPNLGDVTKVDWKEVIAEHGRPDVVVGGSPCQSFSVAGGRESLGGESRLMFEYIRACEEIRSPWIVWENVPGVFSVHDGAFEQLVTSLQDVGYVSLAWRVLDAQFFGVAQRRRRVFLVGRLGSGGGAPAVLFERESVRGNTQASREKRQALAGDAAACLGGKDGRGIGEGAFALNRQIIPEGGTAQGPVETYELCPTFDTHSNAHGVAYAMQTASSSANGPNASSDGVAYASDGAAPKTVAIDYKQSPKVSDDVCHTLTHEGAGGIHSAVAFAQSTRDEVGLQGGDGTIAVAPSAQPRMKRQGCICMSDDTQNASVDVDVAGTLKVGGATPFVAAPAPGRMGEAPIVIGSTNSRASIEEDLSPTLHCRGGGAALGHDG